jgi:hypothetical protein
MPRKAAYFMYGQLGSVSNASPFHICIHDCILGIGDGT